MKKQTPHPEQIYQLKCELGDYFSQIRRSKGISLDAASQLAYVSKDIICNFENGKANLTLDKLFSLAIAYEIKIFAEQGK